MNRTLEARLSRIEARAALDADDRFAGLSDDDLDRLLHTALVNVIANVDGSLSQDQVDDARAKLAELEGHVLDHVRWRQQPVIAAAIASNIAAGRTRQPWDRDWQGLAREWGSVREQSAGK